MIYMEIVCEREMRYRIGISTASSTCVALAQTSWSHRRCVTIRFSVQLADRYIAIGFVQPKACKFTKSNMYHGDGGQISWFAFWGVWLVLDVGTLRAGRSAWNGQSETILVLISWLEIGRAKCYPHFRYSGQTSLIIVLQNALVPLT